MPEKDTPTHPWFMERRYFSLIIVLAFVLLAATAFYISHRHHTINTAQTLKGDRSDANLLSLILGEHLNKLVAVMESYSNRPALLQAVRDKNASKAKARLISLAKSNSGIESVIITDKQGTLWANYPERPEVLGKNFAYRDWYKGVSIDWKPYISEVFLRVVGEKDLAVTISVPFIDKTREVIGILVNTQRTVSLSDLIKQVPLDPGQNITVTDRKGQIIYSSQYNVEKEMRSYPFHPDMKKAMVAKNTTFAVDDHEFGGRTRYISFAPVVDIGWTVFVGRDKRSIFLSGSAYYIQVTAIAFLLFLSVILFLFYSRKQVMAQELLESLQAKEALRKSEAQLLAILDATPFPIALVDTQENKIDFWSQSALTLFGHTAPTAAEWYEIAYPDPNYRREVIERWKPFLEIARESHQTVNTGEYRVTCSDGSARICELYVTFLTDKLMVTFNDITNRKRAEEELRQQTEELRASNDELELFNSAATGRELRMIELKQEINELCHRLGEPPRHAMDPFEIDRVAGAGPTPAEPGGGGA